MCLAESLLTIELPSGEILETGLGVSRLRRVGFGRDRDVIHWRAAQLPARRLARVVAGDAVPTAQLDRPGAAVDRPLTVLLERSPPLLMALDASVATKLVERVMFRSEWATVVRERDPADRPPTDLSGFRRITAPRGRFYAGPFVVTSPGGTGIYVEDCPSGAHRGRISRLRR